MFFYPRLSTFERKAFTRDYFILIRYFFLVFIEVDNLKHLALWGRGDWASSIGALSSLLVVTWSNIRAIINLLDSMNMERAQGFCWDLNRAIMLYKFCDIQLNFIGTGIWKFVLI